MANISMHVVKLHHGGDNEKPIHPKSITVTLGPIIIPQIQPIYWILDNHIGLTIIILT